MGPLDVDIFCLIGIVGIIWKLNLTSKALPFLFFCQMYFFLSFFLFFFCWFFELILFYLSTWNMICRMTMMNSGDALEHLLSQRLSAAQVSRFIKQFKNLLGFLKTSTNTFLWKKSDMIVWYKTIFNRFSFSNQQHFFHFLSLTHKELWKLAQSLNFSSP